MCAADVLTGQGAEMVIAIDVGSEDNNELTNYGDHVSGWYCLWNKINPLAKKIRVSLSLNSCTYDPMMPVCLNTLHTLWINLLAGMI